MRGLKGKTAIVTGGAAGIGAAIVKRFEEEGTRVVVFDLKGSPAVDITDYERVKAAVAQAGAVDILVNNAGVLRNTPIVEMPEAEWDLVQAVNVKGVLFCAKHAIPHMKRAGGGSIVNLSSIYGLVGAPDVTWYNASKGAVRIMTKSAAVQYANDGIRVNSVHPGVIDTELLYENPIMQREDLTPVLRTVPLRRMAEPSEVATLVLFLASDESSYCTGSEFIVDGGVTAG